MLLVRDEMKSFEDNRGAEVTLAFKENAFGQEANHVLVICRYAGNWLLTKHKKRGWEFPGGKREAGESLEQAAAREVLEETGSTIRNLQFIGEYRVKEESSFFIKRIYFAEIEKLEEQVNYYETDGPIVETGDLLTERFKNHYSFIMKDEIIRLSLQKIQAAE